jgi:hypothetical protein
MLYSVILDLEIFFSPVKNSPSFSKFVKADAYSIPYPALATSLHKCWAQANNGSTCEKQRAAPAETNLILLFGRPSAFKIAKANIQQLFRQVIWLMARLSWMYGCVQKEPLLVSLIHQWAMHLSAWTCAIEKAGDRPFFGTHPRFFSKYLTSQVNKFSRCFFSDAPRKEISFFGETRCPFNDSWSW